MRWVISPALDLKQKRFWSLSIHIGFLLDPKIRKDLVARAENLELTIEMGWFWFLSQPMIAAIDFINELLAMGFSILIFTILLKLVLFPVTGKGFKSMAQMKAIPEIRDTRKI